MKDLYMLVGLPGSGKTTFRKNYSAVVSSDDFIESEAKRQGLTYTEAFHAVGSASLDHMYKSAENFLSAQEPIIVWDGTNLTQKSRGLKLDWINQHGGADYRKIAIFFEPSKLLARKVNFARKKYSRDLPDVVLENMFQTVQPPTTSEGFDYIMTISADAQYNNYVNG